MDQLSADGILYKLYDQVDGHGLSKLALSNISQVKAAYNYGEIDFHSFYDILKFASPQPNEIFYDLGSGTGKAVALASLAFPFSKCIGVEELEELYFIAKQTTEQLPRNNIRFIHDDFQNVDFTDAGVLYLNSYYFEYEMSNQIFIKKINALKPGTRIIFVHTPLKIPSLSLQHKSNYLFSWGNATVYITKKE